MNAIDSFPAADMPLRAKLPNISADTRARLVRWGEMQPGSLGWLMGRTALYWEKFPMTHLDGAAFNEHFQLMDATAALDLLRHRIQCVGDREAVEHLNLLNAGTERTAADK